MAYTTINKSTSQFNTKLYTGNGSTQTITGVGFQPDWTWLKGRDAGGESHRLTDVIRGTGYNLRTNSSGAEVASSNMLTSWNSDGFAVGANDASNKNTKNFASWNWKANGSGSANTAGSINSTVSANTTAGFSIVSWTGNGTTGATVGHGLGVKPAMVIMKDRDSGNSWATWHKDLTGESYCMFLDATDAQANYTSIFTSFDTNTFTMGSGSNNSSGSQQIAYCFAEKQGYSKFGSYTGNGNANGTFVYTGFKPAYVMIKSTGSGENWNILDNKRNPSNVANLKLYANSSGAEESEIFTDMVSNGFKIRTTAAGANTSGTTYIYMAVAEAPLVGTNNVPCTAR